MENNGTKTNKVKSKKARKVRARAKAPKVQPTLEFAEPDKQGFRYAQGLGGRFAIGASRHHQTEFALYSRTAEMSRFKLLGKFEDLAQAVRAAEKVDAKEAATPEVAVTQASETPF